MGGYDENVVDIAQGIFPIRVPFWLSIRPNPDVGTGSATNVATFM
jgi:hypothetical protein